MWTPSIDLGAVHGAQYSGYLWPMGPLFAMLALARARVRGWRTASGSGLLFALSAWGMLRLLDLIVGRPRGVPHLLARGASTCSTPTRRSSAARTSVVLLGYAALPWLLLVVHHGVRVARDWRDWRGWWWAAAFALVLTSIGGGINGAVVGWMLVGPARAPDLRAADRGGALARLGRLPGAHRRAGHAGLAVVDRAAGRPRGLRDRLPPVHRAAALDLGHQQRPRGAAADGVLDVVHRGGLLRRATGRSSARPARCSSTRWWWAPRCCCRRWRWPASRWRGASATRPSCCCC